MWVSLRTAIQFALKFVRGFAIPKLLTPSLYGLYSSIGVALRYGKYADCGGVRLMGKRLPAMLSRHGEDGFHRELSRGLTWIVLTSGLAALVLWTLPLYYTGEHLWFYQIAFPIAGFILVGRQAKTLFMGAIRSREEYKSLAQAGIFMTIIGALLQIGLLWAFGVFGLLAGMIATELVVLAFVFRLIPWPGLTWLNWKAIKKIAAQGFQLQALGLANLVLGTVDRLFLLGYFTKAQFGFYSLGMFVANAALKSTGIFRTVIHPKFMRFIEEGEPQKAYELMDDALINFSVTLLVGFPIGYVLLYPTIVWFLPEYAEALPVFYLLAGFAVVQGPFNMLEPLFIARDLEKRLAAYYTASAAFAAMANAVVVWAGGTLEHIVLASIAGFVLLDGLLFRDFENWRSDSHPYFHYVFYAIAAGMVMCYWYLIRTLHPSPEILEVTGQLATVSGLVLVGCLFLFFLKRTRISTAIKAFW